MSSATVSGPLHGLCMGGGGGGTLIITDKRSGRAKDGESGAMGRGGGGTGFIWEV